MERRSEVLSVTFDQGVLFSTSRELWFGRQLWLGARLQPGGLGGDEMKESESFITIIVCLVGILFSVLDAALWRKYSRNKCYKNFKSLYKQLRPGARTITLVFVTVLLIVQLVQLVMLILHPYLTPSSFPYNTYNTRKYSYAYQVFP